MNTSDGTQDKAGDTDLRTESGGGDPSEEPALQLARDPRVVVQGAVGGVVEVGIDRNGLGDLMNTEPSKDDSTGKKGNI